jgi:hypothetical protein
MSILICDRCGDITVDAMSCWCGATVDDPVDLGIRRRNYDAPNPAEAGADDPARRRWSGGNGERTRTASAGPQAGSAEVPKASAS